MNRPKKSPKKKEEVAEDSEDISFSNNFPLASPNKRGTGLPGLSLLGKSPRKGEDGSPRKIMPKNSILVGVAKMSPIVGKEPPTPEPFQFVPTVPPKEQAKPASPKPAPDKPVIAPQKPVVAPPKPVLAAPKPVQFNLTLKSTVSDLSPTLPDPKNRKVAKVSESPPLEFRLSDNSLRKELSKDFSMTSSLISSYKLPTRQKVLGQTASRNLEDDSELPLQAFYDRDGKIKQHISSVSLLNKLQL